jgi:restriction system protein
MSTLRAIPLPPWCPSDLYVHFDPDSGILLIDLPLPYFSGLEIVKPRLYRSGPKLVPATHREARDFANRFSYFLVVRFLWEVPQVDFAGRVTLVGCNAEITYDDPATGRQRTDVVMSVIAKPAELQSLRIERIDPEACFRGLKGIAAVRVTDLVPIAPLLKFDKKDERFVEGKEVLDRLGGENLATMDWQAFEHLIRELFEREYARNGAEVRVTRASRDRGVDAVVFDPDPLHGGKFVIQAKRYVNTVDVSAVRDLYGTVQAEGANKGILVTTSNYGRDAYDFAKDKPLTLLNGANLLSLLEKHGYTGRIDLREARRLLLSNPGE